MLSVTIDHTICSGAQACVRELPAVYGLDDEGYAVVLDASAAPEAAVIASVAACPTGAIQIMTDGEPV